MPSENPWAYNEARNRIRENQESETVILEKKKEDFEVGKEKVKKRKRLDVSELKHRIELGKSLGNLREEIQKALKDGEISQEISQEVLSMLDKESQKQEILFQKPEPDFIFDPMAIPLFDTRLASYFSEQPFGKNTAVDIAGMAYGVAQGSLFLLYILGKMCFDFLLLPRDIYHSFHS